MAVTVQGWGSKKKKLTIKGGKEFTAKRKQEKEDRDSRKTTRKVNVRGEEKTKWWDNDAKKWQFKRPARKSEALAENKPKSEKKEQGKKLTLKVKNTNLNKKKTTSEAGQVEQQDKMTPEQTKRSLELYKNRQNEAKVQAKSDELAAAKKKLKRHASGKNSVAKTKLQLKIRRLEGKKNKKGG